LKMPTRGNISNGCYSMVELGPDRVLFVESLAALQGFQFIQSARPVLSQEPGQAAIRENFSTCLALGTVIRFVVGIANTLNGLTASWAGLSEASMNCHVFPKRRDLLRKILICFLRKPVNPEL
jgi:hypothetical protein